MSNLVIREKSSGDLRICLDLRLYFYILVFIYGQRKVGRHLSCAGGGRYAARPYRTEVQWRASRCAARVWAVQAAQAGRRAPVAALLSAEPGDGDRGSDMAAKRVTPVIGKARTRTVTKIVVRVLVFYFMLGK